MNSFTASRSLFVSAAVSFAGAASFAQTCQPQWQSTGPMAGIDSQVKAAVSWDPDGAGPESPMLVAGGLFDFAGDLEAEKIAAYNSATGRWQPLGAGFNVSAVEALTVFEGDLIAAGGFTSSGGFPLNHIARWDGISWSPLGAGVTGTVRALCIYEGDLIAAGTFASAGGDSTIKRAARWDGKSWHGFGSGISGGQVYALAVYNNQLIAAGTFTSAGGTPVSGVAAWDGAQWHAMGSFDPDFRALTVHDGQLIAAGIFPEYVVKWNEQSSAWENMNNGLSQYGLSLASHGGQLYLGSSPAPNDLPGVYVWNGSAWDIVGSIQGLPGSVNALVDHEGDLVAVGWFTGVSGVGARGVARWDGKSWQSVNEGFNDGISVFTTYDGKLLAGGGFITPSGARGIAKWENESWQPIAGATSTDPVFSVHAFAEFQNQLVVGGSFDTIGGVTANNIARWDGAAWSTLGSGTNSTVYDLAVYNGKLIASGLFLYNAGGVPVNLVAQWNGTSWQALGSGITGGIQPGWDPFINALAVHNGELIVGGGFTTAGGIGVPSIARWNGTIWKSMGSIGGTVTDLFVYDGELIAAGGTNIISRWNGLAWEQLGTPTVQPSGFAVHNGELITIGDPLGPGFPTGTHIGARWDGTSWSSFPGVFDGGARLISYDGELFAGGGFTIVDGAAAAFWSRLIEPVAGDINCDATVDVDDLLAVINAWGACEDPENCPADIAPEGGDDVVDVDDLLAVINNWG